MRNEPVIEGGDEDSLRVVERRFEPAKQFGASGRAVGGTAHEPMAERDGRSARQSKIERRWRLPKVFKCRASVRTSYNSDRSRSGEARLAIDLSSAAQRSRSVTKSDFPTALDSQRDPFTAG